MQDSLGDGFKVKLDENLGAYDGACSFEALLKTACTKQKEECIEQAKKSAAHRNASL